jgi:biopolymer transport protein ExbD
MRFARHAKIFRGPLDAAPLAGVAFLLILFLVLTSLVYTPGALVRLADGAPAPTNAETLEVTPSGALIFRGVAYTNLAQARAALQQPPVGPIVLKLDPAADRATVDQVNSWFEVSLPTAKQLTGANNPALVVAVNFRGQCFFENRSMEEAELKSELRKRLDAARQQSSDLTLSLAMDKGTPAQVLTHLCDLAREVGFKEVLLAGKRQ